MHHAVPLTTSAILLLFSARAFAQEEVETVERSLDTQLVYPSLLPGAAFAVDSPRAWRQFAFQGGAAWQLEHMPLEYFENGESIGAAVTSRNTLHLTAGTTVYSGITVYGRWSAALLDPGVSPRVEPAHTLAAGDLGIGVKGDLIRGERLRFGPHFDLRLPTGTKDSWTAEDKTRYEPGVLLDYDTGPVEVFAHLGLLIRPGDANDTGADFVLGSEVPVGLAVMVPFNDRISALAEATGRMGFENFFQPGAENPFEAKAGVRWAFAGLTQVDLAAGTALDNGYGTADVRVLLSIVNLPRPPKALEVEEVVEVEAPKPSVVEVVVPDQKEEIQWEEGQLAQVVRGRIVIKEPIQFEFATANILPISTPTLEAVARVMNDYPQIEHLLIEGHASEEGSYDYNYKLSSSRANAIYEDLIRKGVRPERLSYRGLGEIVPVSAGTDEASLAANRRVNFIILKVREYLDIANQDSGKAIVSPMTGEEIPAPKMGDKQLSADANPILVEVPTTPTGQDKTPDASEFRKTVLEDEQDGGTSGEQPPAPPAPTEGGEGEKQE